MVFSAEEIETNVVNAINRQVGDKVENLEQVRRLLHHYQVELESLETKVSFPHQQNLFRYLLSSHF